MHKTNTPNIRLTERDCEIFEFVFRFQLMLVEACHRVFFSGKKQEAARSTLRRLENGGYLEAYKEPFQYYRLAPRALSLLEQAMPTLPCEGFRLGFFSGPITRRATLIERSAILAYCTLSETKRRVFTWPEFTKSFQGYSNPPRIPAYPYFVDEHPANGRGHYLVYLIVDTESEPLNQLRRVKKYLTSVETLEPARALLRKNRLRIRLLVNESARVRELKKVFAELPIVEFAVVPTLQRIREARAIHSPHVALRQAGGSGELHNV